MVSMNLYNSRLYLEDLASLSENDLIWSLFHNSSILISGATGLIGSFFVDVIMTRNLDGLNCTVYALNRTSKKAKERFSKWDGNPHLVLIPFDINCPLDDSGINSVDYVLHLASNTHPRQYAEDPIGTITTNIFGVKNMLDFSIRHQAKEFLFASSVEVYGANRGDTSFFDENYCGYINSNSLRAGYPESKRCSEALCQAYKQQYGLDVRIARIARSYGPTMSLHDSRAISQFIIKGINQENIVLKSDGSQLFSYSYVADVVSGLFTILSKGTSGEAYNIADPNSNIRLRDLAELIASKSGTKAVFESPDKVESLGYSNATMSLMTSEKLQSLGWIPAYSIENGISRTMEILSSRSS